MNVWSFTFDSFLRERWLGDGGKGERKVVHELTKARRVWFPGARVVTWSWLIVAKTVPGLPSNKKCLRPGVPGQMQQCHVYPGTT